MKRYIICVNLSILTLGSCQQIERENLNATEIVVKPYLGNIKVKVPRVYKTKSVYLQPENAGSGVNVYETYYFSKNSDSGEITFQFPLKVSDSISQESDTYRYEFMEQKVLSECFIKDTPIRSIITLKGNKTYVVSFNAGFYLECPTPKGTFSVLVNNLKDEKLKADILNSIHLEDWSWKD